MDDNPSFLDKILFRSKYKRQIQKEQEKVEEMKRRLSDKQDEVEELEEEVSKAVTEKQSAYEERNNLQDKVAQLEDKVESYEDAGKKSGSSELNQKQIRGRSNIEEFLRVLSNISYDNGHANTIRFEEDDPEISEYERFNTATLRRISPITVFEDSLSVVRIGIKPPIRSVGNSRNYNDKFKIDRRNFEPSSNLVFGVVRSDIFAVGMYDGWDCRNIETVKTNVKNNHSKGGFSQSRFEESREKQIGQHVEDSRGVLENIMDGDSSIILVGSEQIVSRFQDVADHTGTSDAKGDPESALKKAFNDFWSITVYPNI